MGGPGKIAIESPPISDSLDEKENRASKGQDDDSGEIAKHKGHDCDSPLVSAGRSEDRGRVVGTGGSALMANKAAWKEDICRTAK